MIGKVLRFNIYKLHHKTKNELIAEIDRLRRRVSRYQQRQALLKAIIEDPVDIIFSVVDRNYKLTYFNKCFIDHLKEKYKRVIIPHIGDNLWDYIIDVKLIKSFVDRALVGEKFFVEYVRPKKDRNLYYQSWFSPCINKEKEILGTISFICNITARKEAEIALAKKQEELVESAYRAGMADIASNVMSSVGKALKNIILTGKMLLKLTEESPTKNMSKANALLQSKMENIPDLILNHPQGLKLLQYYFELGRVLVSDKASFKEKLIQLLSEINNIRDFVTAQRKYTHNDSSFEKIALDKVIEYALESQKNFLTRQSIQFNKSQDSLPKIIGNKTKLAYVFVNIIKNAHEAMINVPKINQQFKIEIKKSKEEITCKFADNGEGISEKHLQKIFYHGFSTKKGRVGFGLHCSANYIAQMNGQIYARSEGKNRGATIWVKFSLNNQESSPDDRAEKQSRAQLV